MSDNGWVKLYRKILDKGWYKDSHYCHLWMHLILRANHKPNEWLYKGKIMQVDRGQIIISRKSLSLETGIEQSKIERILSCFEDEQQIKQQNLYINRLITIIKYSQYQNNDQISEQPVNSERTASEQPVNTNKNDKNDKNEKKEDSIGEKTKRFSPPTQEELISYSKEIGFINFDSGRFLDYYDSKGWLIGKTKMKDWKAAVRNWRRNENENKKQIDMEKIDDVLERILNPKIGQTREYAIKMVGLNTDETKELDMRLKNER